MAHGPRGLPPAFLTLPDGRRCAYRQYGDPGGHPVLNCHGGLVSGRDVEPHDALARSLGVRVVSPDRPGMGASARQPGHRLLDWASLDVAALLDHLGIERCSVMGWSAGGQYALAVGHALGARVDKVAVIAGCLPLDQPSAWAELNRSDKVLAGLSRRARPAARGAFWALRSTWRHLPSLAVRTLGRQGGAAEAAAVTAQGRWGAEILAEGSADPAGAVDDYLAMVAPWGFSPEQLAVPVGLFQGTADPLVPEAWATELARRIPGAELRRYPGEGHLIALTRRGEVLEWLLGAPGA